MARSRLLPDNFTLALVATVTLASLLPASGAVGAFFEKATVGVVALLFFMHGAKLSREAVIAGIGHWRLHLLVVASTFMLFPVLGLVLRPVLQPLVTPELYTGVLFLCVLPAT
ncbi:MAG: bile acid:sodium symporter, partial [Diaphorobacter nitroreducens]